MKEEEGIYIYIRKMNMYICMYAWKMKGMSMSFMFVMRTYVRIWAYMGVWSVCMYVYIAKVGMRIHTYIHTYIHICIGMSGAAYAYIHTYLYVCEAAYVWMDGWMYVCMYVCM